MSYFNNREAATAIWVGIFLLWASSKKPVRESLVNVVKAFFRVKIVASIMLMMLYVLAIVAGLYRVGLWRPTLIKDTVLWFCLTAIAMSIHFVSSNSGPDVFRKIIRDNIKLVMVVEFLVSTYPFSLIGELVLIPVMTMITMLDAVARSDKQYSAAARLTTGVQMAVGSAIVAFSSVKAIHDYKNLQRIDSLRSILLAPVLSIMFSPFVYAMLVFAKYEVLFIQLELGPGKERSLKRYAQRRIIMYCGFNLRKIADLQITFDLMRIEVREDVDRLLDTKRKRVRAST